jgi:hypothetical protein
MDWLGYDHDYEEKQTEVKEDELTWQERMCFHEWKAILLITSTVYDCVKCGIKKEKIDRLKKEGKTW